MFQRLYIAILVLMLTACNSLDDRYIVTKRVDVTRSSYPFSFMMRDSLLSYDLTLFVRHTTDFTSSDLPFRVAVTTPSNIEWCDTLLLPIYDGDGEPLGKRNVVLYNVDRVIIKSMRFREQGYYNITLTPITPELDGLVDIGIKIEETE